MFGLLRRGLQARGVLAHKKAGGLGGAHPPPVCKPSKAVTIDSIFYAVYSPEAFSADFVFILR